MAQYKVPQNIDMQDKIFGPLTLFQFLYLLIGGMFSYALLKTSIYLFIAFGIPVVVLALAFAFVKVQDQPFSKFLASLVHYLLTPKTWVWHKGPSTVVTIAEPPGTKKPLGRAAPKKFDLATIRNVASRLDTG